MLCPSIFFHCQIAFLHRRSKQFIAFCLQGTPFAYQIKLRLLGLAVKALYHLDLAHISSLVYLCPLLQTNEPVSRECPVLSQLTLFPPIATCWNFPHAELPLPSWGLCCSSPTSFHLSFYWPQRALSCPFFWHLHQPLWLFLVLTLLSRGQSTQGPSYRQLSTWSETQMLSKQ